MAKNTVLLTFAGDSKSLDSAFAKLQGNSAKTETGLQKLGRTAKIAAGVFLGGLALAARVGFAELKNGQAISAQTGAVLKSTGMAANVTAKQVDTLSASLSAKSGVDDDVIQSGANVLLTFTNVRNEVGKGNNIFSQATATALDMSVALGTDLKGANIQLGKALNDPIKGIGALSRVGVTFTKGQKAQIKALVDSGKSMEAQKIILAELNKEFGGSAAAAGKTLPGQLNIAKNAFDNLAGSLVGTLLPAFLGFAGVLGTVLGWLSSHETTTKILVGTLGTLAVGVFAINKVMAAGTAIKAAHAAITAIVTTQTTAQTAATGGATVAQTGLNAAMRANPIGLVITAIALLAAGLVLAWKNSDTFRAIVTTAFNAVKTAAETVWNWISKNWPLLLAILTGPIGLAVLAISKHWDTIRSGATGAKNWITDKFDALVTFVTGVPGRISSAASGMFDGIKNAFRDAVNWIIGRWNGLSFGVGSVDTHIPGIGKVGGFSIETPNIPLLANGGIFNGAQAAIIGEAGPEVVIPLTKPRRAAELMERSGLTSNSGVSVNIQTMVVRDSTDIHRVASQLGRQLAMRGA